MNWQTKRRLAFAGVAAMTLGPLIWVGVVAWSIAETKRSTTVQRDRAADLRQELEGALDFVDPEALLPAVPGGETAPAEAALTEVSIAPGENVAAFLGQLELMADDAGVEVLGVDLLPSSTAGRTTYSLEAVGGLEQVCELIGAIERLTYLAIVENLDLQGRDDGRVEVALGVARFHN